MGFFGRIGTGWQLAVMSFKVIFRNKTLALLPIVSTLALILVLASFALGIAQQLGYDFKQLENMSETMGYVLLFGFYFVSYLIILFFNMALTYCALQDLNGKSVSVMGGIGFSISKIGKITSWALISATVGMILRIIEDKNQKIAAIIAGIFGMLWSLLTFFVVPVMIVENIGPMDAIKRSSALLKETWGERIGADFAFGIIAVLCFIGLALPIGFLIGNFNPTIGIAAGMILGILIVSVTSAAEVVFRAAAYQYAVGAPTGLFEKDLMKNCFSRRA